jgi:hypothetical protein
MKERGMSVAVILVLAVASSCTDRVVVDRGTSDVVVRMRAGPTAPVVSLSFQGTTQKPGVGSNCWAANGAETCIDTVPDVVIPKRYVDVPRGTRIRIDSDTRSFTASLGTVSVSGNETDLQVVQKLEFKGRESLIDVPPGEYTLQIDGEWKQGTVPLYFGIRVT